MVKSESRDWSGAVLAGSLLLLALGAVATAVEPVALWVLLGAVTVAGLLGLALAFPVAACAFWFVLAGTTPEMLFGDVLGGGSLILAGVKLAGLVLVGVCVLRYGGALDLFNPGFAFVLMFGLSFVHGRAPDLDTDESVRSLIGSVAPFAFSFSRLSRGWAETIIRLTRWLPVILVSLGLVAQATGLRPLFVADNGWRMEATGHPAFLGGFTLAAIEACLLELLRDGRRGHLVLIAVNVLILVASGARAPMAIAVGVTGIATLTIRSRRFGLAPRVTLGLAAACAAPLLALAASLLTDIRLFKVVSTEAGDLSGRDLIWPFFQDAWATSPWFGWGVGAGKTVMPADSELVRLLGTTAAHDEYLRIGVEGGWIGLGVLVALFVLWTWRHTRRMHRPDRSVMRLVMLAFAVHAYTDNVLIATTSSVLFAWVSAVFARGAIEAAQPVGAKTMVQ